MLPLVELEECFRIEGIIGADSNPVRTPWWQSVQLTALLLFDGLFIFQIFPGCRYWTGWMLLLVSR